MDWWLRKVIIVVSFLVFFLGNFIVVDLMWISNCVCCFERILKIDREIGKKVEVRQHAGFSYAV